MSPHALFLVSVLIRLGFYLVAGGYALRRGALPCAGVGFLGAAVTAVSFVNPQLVPVLGAPLVGGIAWVIVTAADRRAQLTRVHRLFGA